MPYQKSIVDNKVEPSDFLDPTKTVYRYDQVVTANDLKNAMRFLLAEYDAVSPIHMLERTKLEIAIKTLNCMLDWVESGKGVDFEGLI
jgi:hypothetical protein